jgi:uncharacterized membrane protein
MISNHFPATFGHEKNMLILALICLAGAGIKHFHNQWERGESNKWVVPLSVGFILTAIYITAPVSRDELLNAEKVSFSEIHPIIQQRCSPCHAKNCTDDVYIIAQKGIMFDSPELIVQHKDKILSFAVINKTMPQGNKTRITQDERDLLEKWIIQGAKLD